ncbi:MAG: hypothetical protein WD316_12095 [Phycisphaeraceae bacterium]
MSLPFRHAGMGRDLRRCRACAAPLLALIAAVGMAAVAGTAGVVAAQPGDAPPPLRLDIETLLLSDDVLAERITDPVWAIEARPERQLVLVPLLIGPVDQPLELEEPTITLRGGRFVAWHVTEDEVQTSSRGRGGRGGRGGGGGGGGGDDMYMNDDLYIGGYDRQMGGGPVRRGPALPAEAEVDEHGVPADAPRLARSITLTPDGRIQWGVATAISGAEIGDGDGRYVLRLRPDRLRELAPSRDDGSQQQMTGRRQDEPMTGRERAEQRRELREQFQAEREAFMDLREAVQELDETFDMPAPTRVWAVFELPAAQRSLAFDGDAPLPWSIGLDDYEAVRQFVGTRGRRGREAAMSLNALTTLARSEHPYTRQIAAHAAAAADVASNAEPFSDEYRLLTALLEADDDTSRHAVLESLASMRRPSEAGTRLLREVADHPNATTRLLALRGLLAADPGADDHLAQLLGTVSDMLADPSGPPADVVLEEIIVGIGSDRRIVDQVTTAIAFDRLSGERLDQAVRYIIDTAPREPLAAAWLDDGLLASGSDSLVRQTLAVLAEAQPDANGGDRQSSALGWAIGRVLGGRGSTDSAASEQGPSRGRIVIESADHAIFPALASDDPATRELAWQALGRFSFVEEGDMPRFGGVGRSDDRVDSLVSAALAHEPTPPQAASFLARHEGFGAGAPGLVRLAGQATGEAASIAGRALWGSQQNLTGPVGELEPAERYAFAAAVYEGRFGRVPATAGLMLAEPRDRRDDTASWFADQVADGRDPQPGDWVAAFGGEMRLAQLLGADEPELAAGAAAALVAAAGADDDEVESLARELAGEEDPRAAWRQMRQSIHARQLAHMEGEYRMVMLLRGEANQELAEMNEQQARAYLMMARQQAQEMTREEARAMGVRRGPAAGDKPVTDRVNLGVVDVIVEDTNVRLAGDIVSVEIPETRFALRITQLAELRNIPGAALDHIPLGRTIGDMDLTPQPDGAWVGQVDMLDTRVLELRLEPVR